MAVAVAVAAVVAEAVAVAAVAVAAVCLGVPVASAKSDHFPIALANTLIIGRVRQGRPGQSMFSLRAGRLRAVVRSHMTAEWVPNLVE